MQHRCQQDTTVEEKDDEEEDVEEEDEDDDETVAAVSHAKNLHPVARDWAHEKNARP